MAANKADQIFSVLDIEKAKQEGRLEEREAILALIDDSIEVNRRRERAFRDETVERAVQKVVRETAEGIRNTVGICRHYADRDREDGS